MGCPDLCGCRGAITISALADSFSAGGDGEVWMEYVTTAEARAHVIARPARAGRGATDMLLLLGSRLLLVRLDNLLMIPHMRACAPTDCCSCVVMRLLELFCFLLPDGQPRRDVLRRRVR